MKNTLLLRIGIALGALSATHSATAQMVGGNFVIDPYAGFPNIGKVDLKERIDIDAVDLSMSGVIPLGLRAEYVFLGKFGLGLDFVYDSFRGEVLRNQTDVMQVVSTFVDEYDVSRIRAMLRFNWHIVRISRLDLYIGLGAGVNLPQLKSVSNDPNFSEIDLKKLVDRSASVRFAAGARVYVTKRIGISVEAGWTGPPITTGLSFKF